MAGVTHFRWLPIANYLLGKYYIYNFGEITFVRVIRDNRCRRMETIAFSEESSLKG